MANYKVIALDFDGTTACTIPAIYHSARKMLELHGYSVDKQVVYDNFGLALPFAFRCFAGDDTIDDATIEQMIVEYNNIYKEEGERLIELFEGVPETLRKLKEAGLTIVIASNNIRPVLDRLTRSLGIDEYIDDIVSVEDVENVKPAPDIALEVMRRYNAKGEEVLVVGDSTFDMDMGRGAGCHLCGVTYGSHTPEMLRETGARYMIDHFSELIDIAVGK
ncbi:MAG: HAD family hydrolase [Rikenellaceae bacterium]|nr:HAD family hydrolase [Rikenellaceae bacterium]